MADLSRDPWPLRHLVLRTPRLTLRPDDDEGVHELAAVALRGVHPPEEMPFGYPWTDQAPDDLVRGVVQYHWNKRSELTSSGWTVNFLVRHDGQVIGEQSVSAKAFSTTREVWTGSWLGLAHQRRGFGTEMRAAVLLLAFNHLGATAARSGAYADNPASLRVSEALGYRRDGTSTWVRRGAAVTEIRLVVEARQLIRPKWTLEVDGLAGCRTILGAI
jgi:RimJ/RimL family protein N-acetyltransferase